MSAPVTGTVVSTKTPSASGAVFTMGSVTCSGSNRGLVVDLMVYYASGAILPDSVTFNSLAMTRIKSLEMYTDVIWQARYFYTAPATGAHSVVADCTTGGIPIAIWIRAIPIEDVNQTTPYRTSVSAVWDQVTPVTSFNVTDTNSDATCLELDSALGVRGGANPVLTVGASQTSQKNDSDAGIAFAASTKSGAVNVVMAWTGSSDYPAHDVAYGLISTALIPVGATAGFRRPSNLAGVGGPFFGDALGG